MLSEKQRRLGWDREDSFLWRDLRVQQSRLLNKILHTQACLLKDAFQRTGGNGLVIGHGNAHLVLTQPYVRPGLPEDGEPRPFERANDVCTRQTPGQFHAAARTRSFSK